MEKEIVKEYNNGDLTVVWKPKKCIHAAECVKALPKVYDPKAKPWITPENATTEQLKAQISLCPSGALSYKGQETMSTENTKVDVMANGPLLVHGTCVVKNHDGQEETRDKMTAFCRCGHSKNKPYCDGAHKAEGFVG